MLWVILSVLIARGLKKFAPATYTNVRAYIHKYRHCKQPDEYITIQTFYLYHTALPPLS